jgi:hypothetical protein
VRIPGTRDRRVRVNLTGIWLTGWGEDYSRSCQAGDERTRNVYAKGLAVRQKSSSRDTPNLTSQKSSPEECRSPSRVAFRQGDQEQTRGVPGGNLGISPVREPGSGLLRNRSARVMIYP